MVSIITVAQHEMACARCEEAFSRSALAWDDPKVEREKCWELYAEAEGLWHGETQESLQQAKAHLAEFEWIIWEMDILRAGDEQFTRGAEKVKELKEALATQQSKIYKTGKRCFDAQLAAHQVK